MSYAEITLKSGAVVTFDCTEVSWRRDGLSESLKWTLPEGSTRRPVRLDLTQVAAVVFVDTSGLEADS